MQLRVTRPTQQTNKWNKTKVPQFGFQENVMIALCIKDAFNAQNMQYHKQTPQRNAAIMIWHPMASLQYKNKQLFIHKQLYAPRILRLCCDLQQWGVRFQEVQWRSAMERSSSWKWRSWMFVFSTSHILHHCQLHQFHHIMCSEPNIASYDKHGGPAKDSSTILDD